MITRVPEAMYGGTMVRTPLLRMAGLYDDEAVWPFTDGSVSTISSTTVRGSSRAIGTSLCVDRTTVMFSCR
jgi:hypothetical protein